MPFKDNNEALGLRDSDAFQVGVSDIDSDGPGDAERGILLPWPKQPEFSWVYYECNVEVQLDSGIVVHNTLPQIDNAPDTLASCDYDSPHLAKLISGVNLRSNDQYTDTVQRMAHSRYFFRLYGRALRIGYQVPIPSIKYIGGVLAVPYDGRPQVAFNRIAPFGNFGSGLILWHAEWSLWYTTASPPRNNAIPSANPAALIVEGDNAAPAGVQAPYDQPDDNAVRAAPPMNAKIR